MAVTQKQIANELGVSWSLVTRALRDHPSVAPATKERIQEAARRLGYNEHSNREARLLIARRYGHQVRTNIIAVTTPRYLGGRIQDVPFFATLLEGIEIGADQADLDIYLARQRKTRYVPLLIQGRNVDGVICLQPNAHIQKACASLDIPVVSLFANAKGSHALEPDNRDGIRQAVRHLVELGHRRIAYLGQEQDSSIARERLQGYREALREHGIQEDPNLVEATLRGVVLGAKGLDQLLARNAVFSALVCYNDTIAMAAVQRLTERGYQVPQQVSVVGFDDTSAQHHFSPAITSIHFDGVAMGRRAVELLGELFEAPARDDSKPKRWQHELFPVQLKIRATTMAVKSRPH